MVQLELSAQLLNALESIRPALPAELADQVDQLVLSTLPPSEALSSDPKPSPAGSVPHSVLLGISKWARNERRSDAGAVRGPAGPCTTLTRVLAGLYTLAALLRLTHPYTPPLVPRERVRLPLAASAHC